MSAQRITINPGDCLAICPCCLARVIVAPFAGISPTITHGLDRLSGEPCPRTDDSVADSILWNRDSEDEEPATVYDFPEHFAVETTARGIRNPYLEGNLR